MRRFPRIRRNRVTRVNPFTNENLYVNPSHPAVQTRLDFIAASRTADAESMRKISQSPDVPYFFAEWTEAQGNQGIGYYVDYWANHYRNTSGQNALPMFGLYALMQRDCGSYSSGGWSTLAQYKTWVNAAAAAQSNRKIVWIIEPDSLPWVDCVDSGLSPALSNTQISERYEAVGYAVETLMTANPNAYVYIDAGHSAWISATTMSGRMAQANIERATGFFSNSANYQTTANEIMFCEDLSTKVGSKGYIIATQYNGLGPYTGGTHDGGCAPHLNPPGRALGERPSTTIPTGALRGNAFLWLTGPGNSNGACGTFASYPAGTWMPEYALGLCQSASWAA